MRTAEQQYISFPSQSVSFQKNKKEDTKQKVAGKKDEAAASVKAWLND